MPTLDFDRVLNNDSTFSENQYPDTLPKVQDPLSKHKSEPVSNSEYDSSRQSSLSNDKFCNYPPATK